MARPDLKNQRRQQILDAFEFCVASFGVEGATLAKTAEQAGLARALIRHNVGNRDDLVAALTEQYLQKSGNVRNDLLAALPAKNRTKSLIDMLFDPSHSNPHLVRVANALIAASSEDSKLAAHMQTWLRDFIALVEQVVIEDHPKTGPDRVSAVAAGIVGIYFNVEALYPIGDIEALSKASKQAALMLVETLNAE